VATDTRFRVTPQVVIGLLIVAWGLTLTAGNVGWIEDTNRLLRWFWPLGLLSVGLVLLLGQRERSGKLFGGLLVLFGLASLADRLDYWIFNPFNWWPLLLVFFGFLLISRSRGGVTRDGQLDSTDSTLSTFAFWSGVRRRITGVFRRADLTAIMGGIEIDLRPATITGDAVIDIFAMWGGIDLTVPPDIDISNEIVAIMGGVDDKTGGTSLGDGRKVMGGIGKFGSSSDPVPGMTPGRPRIILRGFAIMGGVEIKS
jgi:LiaF transmembrane domain